MQALSITRNLYRQFIIYGLVALVFAGLNTAKAEPIKILALGDSLTAGYGLGPSEGLTAQLQAQLDKLYGDDQILVINAGVSGDTTRGGLARLDWALADNPDVVMVALGGNDMLRGLEPFESMENLKNILSKLQAAGKPTLLAGMLAPSNMGARYTQEFDAIYPTLADDFDVIFYPFFLEGVALDPNLNLPDGLHPNREGIAIMVDGLLPFVQALIERKM